MCQSSVAVVVVVVVVVVAVAVVFVFVFVVSVVSVVCDQGDQVVPAYQDDIDEVHELDTVHQVDHKDEYTSDHIS